MDVAKSPPDDHVLLRSTLGHWLKMATTSESGGSILTIAYDFELN